MEDINYIKINSPGLWPTGVLDLSERGDGKRMFWMRCRASCLVRCVFAESVARLADWRMVPNCVKARRAFQAPPPCALTQIYTREKRPFVCSYGWFQAPHPTLTFQHTCQAISAIYIQPSTAPSSYIEPYTTKKNHMQPYTPIYSHIQPYTTIYSHIQPYTAIYSHMQPYTAIYTAIYSHTRYKTAGICIPGGRAYNHILP